MANELIHGRVLGKVNAQGVPVTIPLACDQAGKLMTGGTTYLAGTITRPANVTAYTANDAVVDNGAAAIDFGQAVINESECGYVTRAFMTTSQVGCTARFRLWLFNHNPPVSLVADNAAFGLNLADGAASCVGYIDFAACAPGNNCAYSLNKDIVLHFHTLPAYGTHLIGILQTLDAFTPDNGQYFVITLGIERS